MPDASRLIAAICLAIIAFLVSQMVVPLMPEGTDFGYFTYVNIAIGVLCGWIIMGKRAGRGVVPAINNGLTGVAALLFWGLFVQGTYEMVDLAMRNRYGGPFEALTAIFEIGAEYGLMILVPNIIATVLIGGVLAGLATEGAWRRWK
jgi:hypothetical protein